jgi:cytidylate kinase
MAPLKAPGIPVIAIDGPSASGKGTVAARVAAELGFHYLDSGALYRLTALAARTRGLRLPTLEDDATYRAALEAALADCAAGLDAFFADGEVLLDGRPVTEALRDERTSQEASRVAVLGGVRAALLARQRAFRRPPGLVTDGRDMATVVFPDAILKVFLTASAEERANRRYKQLIENGSPVKLDDLLRDIRERDARDVTRTYAPLVQDAGAGLLDTTCLTAEAAVAEVLRRYKLCDRPTCE